jgi:hypothetical protein
MVCGNQEMSLSDQLKYLVYECYPGRRWQSPSGIYQVFRMNMLNRLFPEKTAAEKKSIMNGEYPKMKPQEK